MGKPDDSDDAGSRRYVQCLIVRRSNLHTDQNTQFPFSFRQSC